MLKTETLTKQQTQQLPQTAGFPLIGSLPQLLKQPFHFVTHAQQQYGDIYKLDLGLSKVVVLNHPEHAQHVLRDHAANYRKGGPMWDAVRSVLGNGLVVSEGDFWLRQRRMMQPQFHRQRLTGLTELMVEAISESLDEWQLAHQPLNITPKMNRITMNVIIKTLFGAGITKQTADETAEAMTYALDYMISSMVTNQLPSWLPIPGKKKFQQVLARFDKTVYAIIEQCRQEQEPQNHLLAMLLDTVDAETGEGMTNQQLRDEVATLFLAGYETTSITLSWALWYLSQHPHILGDLRREIETVLGDRQPAFTDLPELQLTKMVLNESMRLRPPAFWLPRVAVEDDEIDGYHIPAGTNVVSLTYMYHRHPGIWDDPEAFDPYRFAPDQVNKRHRFAFVPFGAGQRMCIGRDFALMEGQLALAMILQRFNIFPVSGFKAEPQLSTTLRPKNGVLLNITPRS